MAKKLRFFYSVKNLFSNNWNFIFNSSKTFISKSWSHFKTKPLEFIGFIATLLALYLTYESNQMTRDSNYMTQQSLVYSQKATEQSDFQFKENNKSQNEQDALIQIQHDSMMSVLKQQQIIGEAQLRNIKEQNQITKQIQKLQIETESPQIVIQSRSVRDTHIIVDNKFRPRVTIIYKNIGKRSLYNYSIKIYHIGLDFNFFAFNDDINYANPLQPNEDKADLAQTSMRLKDKDGFYIFFRIKGVDKLTNKTEQIDFYFKYCKLNSEWYVYDCDEAERTQIIKFLKTRVPF